MVRDKVRDKVEPRNAQYTFSHNLKLGSMRKGFGNEIRAKD